MPGTSNNYVFCADYSSMATCLSAMAGQESAGLYDDDLVLLGMLNQLQNDLLKKLYNRVLRILGIIDGVIDISLLEPGDFDSIDFSSMDFQVGYLDTSRTGYSSTFQTILNIFSVFCSRENELSQSDIDSLAAAFFPVLDAFNELQLYLSSVGLNPCQNNGFNYFNNSPAVRLQAAGSDGSGGISEGILLRWLLNGELGENHLPQGNYANNIATPTGFNRADDYVYLSKTLYTAPLVFTIDFGTARAAVDFQKKKWTYIINKTQDGKLYSNIISLTFKDTAAYISAAQQFDPQLLPAQFLGGYNGMLEIAVQSKTFYKFSLGFHKSTGSGAATVKLEAMALPDDGTGTEVAVLRDSINFVADEQQFGYEGENMRRVILLQDGSGSVHSFTFETYHDFLNSRPSDAWSPVGAGFSLSVDDETVLRRLEDTSRGLTVDHAWPQFRDGTTVRVLNYQDKWNTPASREPSLKESVTDYLLQSQTGEAHITINLSGNEDDPGTSFSYVDLINLQAVDYHLARMLGMGYVDIDDNIKGGGVFVYRITYFNKPSVNAASVTHTYLGMPVGKADLRLPEKPVMKPVSYRLADDSNLYTGTYNEQGYDLKSNTRLINIGRAAMEAEISEIDFFNGNNAADVFNHAAHCSPVMYGIEYRSAEGTYVLPYITDSDISGKDYFAWNDTFDGNLRETVPVFDNPESLFLHFEKKSGIHYYAIYGVDLFSRPSALSDEEGTDNTVFPPDNQLKPPTDITVQYIQPEDTLIFTSGTEQLWLKGRNDTFPGEDTALTRVTFNWVDMMDITALDQTSPTDLAGLIKGNAVAPMFRSGEPLQVSGVIREVREISETQVVLLAGKYNLLDNTTVVPAIADTDLAKFTGSLLLTPDGQFTVVSAVNVSLAPLPGVALYFTVEKAPVTERVDDPDDATAIGTRSYHILPLKDSRFTVAENLAAGNNWNQLNARIELIDQSNHQAPVIDTITDTHGNVTRLWIGGIHAVASVVPATDGDSQIMPGYYVVTFGPAVMLSPHPQNTLPFEQTNSSANAPGAVHAPYVEWYNGKVFLPLEDPADGAYADDPFSGKKLLDVVRVTNDTALTLYVYDAGYADEPHLKLSQNGQTDIQVNYHPGYRAYLLPEPPPQNAFNQGSILPQAGANDKKSLLAFQTLDIGSPSGDFHSAISLPAILLALNIMQPEQPEAPLAAILKVRPNATRKAAFTFDLKVGPDAGGNARRPFGWMFYRTHNEQVLHSLYLPETAENIVTALEVLTDEPYFADRYLDLLSLQFDPLHYGRFKKYPPEDPNAYGFPMPDLPSVANDANGNPYVEGDARVIANYFQAIHSTLMPLSEQIPVLAYIKTGTQTENKQPVIRSVDGNLLSPADANFDPFPMVRTFTKNEPNTAYIRFTDYNLSGSSRFLYFYAAAEVTNRLAVGPLSRFTGPVTILNIIPGEAPVVRSSTTAVNSTASSSPVMVTFDLSPFPGYDTITAVRIFRTADPEKTERLGSMDSFLDAQMIVQDDTGITVTDDFSDLNLVPLGETVYYRLSFIRRIVNEFDLPEDIVSQGSDTVPVKLVDMFNPAAPDLKYDEDSRLLKWPATANKGKYYLYQQNSLGNWQKIYEVTDNTANTPMTYTPAPPLAHVDQDGNAVYTRFKVKAENASGLFNLTDNEITV